MLEVLAAINRVPEVLRKHGIHEDDVLSLEADFDKESPKVSVLLHKIENVQKFDGWKVEEEFLSYSSEWRKFGYAECEGISFQANEPI